MEPSPPGSALAKTSSKKGGGGKRITSETSPSSSSSSSGQIVVPTLSDRDVLLGRGGDVQNRPGNQFFRSLVNQHAQAYADLPPGEKPQIAFLIVSTVRQQGGRFLKVKPQKKSSRKKQQQQEIYLDIGEKEALSKTSQALRSATHRLRKRKRPGDVDSNESSSSSTEHDEEETKISSRSLQQQQQPQQSVASMDRGPTASTPARSMHAAAAASPYSTAAAAAASPMSSTLPQDSATASSLRPLTDPIPGEPQEIAFLLQRATHFRNLALQDEQRALTLRSLLRQQQQSQDRVQAPTPSRSAFATQDSALLPSLAGNNLLLSTLFPDSFGSTQVSTEERILQQLSNQTAATTGLEDLLSRNPLFQSARDPSSQHQLLSPQDSLLARLAGLPSVAATSGSLSLEQQQLLQAARLLPQERNTAANALSSLLSPSDQQLLARLSGSLPQHQQQPQLALNQQQPMGVTGRGALLQHLLMGNNNNNNPASLQDLLSQNVAGVPDGESKLGEQQQQQQQSEARRSSGSASKRPRRG